MADFAIKQGDTDPLEVRLVSDHATNWTLDGTVVLNMRKQGSPTNKITRGACEILSGTDHTVRYRFSAADTNTAGTFNVEIEQTSSDGIVRTFPSGKDDANDYFEVQVTPQLG